MVDRELQIIPNNILVPFLSYLGFECATDNLIECDRISGDVYKTYFSPPIRYLLCGVALILFKIKIIACCCC